MLRRSQQFYFQLLQVADAFLLCIALWAAYSFRTVLLPEIPFLNPKDIGPFGNYLWLLVVILPLGPLLLELNGVYRLQAHSAWHEELLSITRAVFLLLLILVVFLFIFKIPQQLISRAVFLLFLPIGIGAVWLRHEIFHLWMSGRGRSSVTRQHLLLVGRPNDLKAWHEQFSSLPKHLFSMRGEIDLRTSTIADFITLLHEGNIDVAVFDLDHDVIPLVRQAILACEAEGVEAWVTTDLFRTTLAKPKFDEFMGRPLIVFRTTPDASWEFLGKKIIDRAGAFVLLLLLSPVFLAVSLLVLFNSGRPVFFTQKRSGRYGRPFIMYKFRSMVSNAEQRKVELQMLNAMKGPVFKIEGDPRITPIGRFIRRFSLDELPQLWNVLKGEMSLVGPRPLPVYETENFEDFSQRRRMSVNPGLTCLWQVAGRNEITDFKDWVRLDLEYIDTWSLSLDIKILLRTIPAVFRGRGAK